MTILDVTVVNVALPSIGADLSLDRAFLTWVVTAYTLCFGGLMLLGGRLADTLGRRHTFLAGLGLFTLASLASGLAQSVVAAARPPRVARRVDLPGALAATLATAAVIYGLVTAGSHGWAAAATLVPLA